MATAQSSPTADAAADAAFCGKPHDPVTLPGGVTLDVVAAHGPDWFPVRIEAGGTSLTMTLFLRRDELRKLLARLTLIDMLMPATDADREAVSQ